MRVPRLKVILLGACAGLLLAQCASTPEKKEKEGKATLARLISREWIQQARMIPLGQDALYYQGESETGAIMPLVGWAGTLTGEVLIVRKGSATACTRATIDPKGRVTVESEEYTATQEPPNEWEHLLPPPPPSPASASAPPEPAPPPPSSS